MVARVPSLRPNQAQSGSFAAPGAAFVGKSGLDGEVGLKLLSVPHQVRFSDGAPEAL